MASLNKNDQAIALSRIANGISLTETSRDLNIPYSQLLKLKDSLDVRDAADAPRELVTRVAEEMKQELSKADVQELEKTVDGLGGLQLLNSRVQEVGLKLADRIAVVSVFTEDAREILMLADALTKIQTAFFKSGPAVNILNQTNNMSESGVSTFANLLRD